MTVRIAPAPKSPEPSSGVDRKSLLFVTGCLFEESSGPYLTLKQTAEALQQRGHAVTVVGTKPWGAGQPGGWSGEVQAFRRYGPLSAHFAPRLGQWLRRQPARWEVASLQGVWMHTNHLVAEWCIRHDRPFMITTHGNFNPVALRISAWKKTLARMTFMRRVFAHVTCYQASTEIEYRTLREYGIRKPICIIGNGIELPGDQPPASAALVPVPLPERRMCLYLGRLFPIKGIDRLIRVWGRLHPGDDWQLVIAGGGEPAYRAELESLARREHCQNVHFTGFVSIETKAALLRQAEVFILPSHSEAFAMAPMEAFSYGTPALLTTTCGFPEAAEAGAALEVVSSDDAILEGLRQLLALSPESLRIMGERARTLVRDRYSWDNICDQLEQVYGWMRDGGETPASVRLD